MGIVKITKIEDDFKGKHPNNINKGAIIGGLMLHPPKVGESFWVNTFATSTVVEIIDENTFRTLNSVYKIEYNGEVKIFNESKKTNTL